MEILRSNTIAGKDRGKQFGIVLVPKGISFDKEIDEFLEKLKKASKDEEVKNKIMVNLAVSKIHLLR